MARDMVTLVQRCGVCSSELGTLEFKKENMMLSSKETVWCPTCQADRPQIREAEGRAAAIEEERKSYPASVTTEMETQS